MLKGLRGEIVRSIASLKKEDDLSTLVAALVGVPLVKRLELGCVLGYLLACVLIDDIQTRPRNWY